MRIKQFFRAVTARIFPSDRKYIRQHLPSAGAELFAAMAVHDARHALNTAYTAEKLAARHKLSLADKNLLIRCALLHDVGRHKGSMGISGKVIAVLAAKIAPRMARRFAHAEGKFNFLLRRLRQILFVYYEHPQIGADKLETVGLTREAALVRHHHAPPQPGESVILTLLRQSDELN